MTEISRPQFAVYLIAVVLVVLLGGRALRAADGPAEAGAVPAGGFAAGAEGGTPPGTGSAGAGATGRSSAGGATGATGGVEVTTSEERVLVDVAGAVRRPGVYELPAGARVRDALTAAGGGRSGANLQQLNRAAKVTDGQQVVVARRGRTVTSTAGSTPGVSPGAGGAATSAALVGAAVPGATVNVNQADATQLEALNGVGPAIAAKIVEWRTQNGPFKTVDDLAQVSGIGPKKLEAMRSQVAT